ncbi:MAG: orotidine-5'-phosphate decarboxylase [Proteobacteria bacterium]|nr:orotidine-5'-phosphate decarboxylase [Pseudomonadota bacterium]
MHDPRIIVALDFSGAQEALQLARKLKPHLCRLKVGKELFTAAGPQLIEKLRTMDYEIFLDLKFHDIPNTAASACRAAANLGVWMVNVHALGGRRMLTAVRDAIPHGSTKLIAVTLLTSMDQNDIADIGLQGEPEQVVTRLAKLTKDCGLDGVVCSALEAVSLRQQFDADFCLVTPGIRPTVDQQANDQKRIATPQQAMRNGASYLVIGRPITQADDPISVLQKIQQEIDGI